jgi:hypothetical protein
VLREFAKSIWYAFFSRPPRYCLGIILTRVLGSEFYDKAVASYVCKTEALEGPQSFLYETLTFVEDYKFHHQLDEPKRLEIAKSFWSGTGGNRWNLVRYKQMGEEYFPAYADCAKMIQSFVEERPEVRHIYEMGCGNGQALSYFSKKMPSHIQIEGIDINETTISLNYSLQPLN